ncbi:hypothetical protein QQS21_008714 [Conoideocrella luteorostrata]|uniref:Zn(2)-C6 fungal-type domain-containing protein n=1 Tax=Conoideocrella luteorostrata TaxID=1105319 RepID=A0AAJ0CIB8_9HYPO|nr:hypothetical protein QQS21_008714 [Conoideocrella luteorostrata]
MTPTPPSTNSSNGGRSPEDQFRVIRKRNRVPLSCYPCRTRKKCDRNHPCSNCTKREGMDTTACSYAAPTSRKKSQNQGDSSPDDMQSRIDRLEGLVLSLMHNGENIDTNAPRTSISTSQSVTDSGSSAARQNRENEAAMAEDESDVDEHLAKSIGVLKVDADKGKSMYIGQEHWHLILSDIAEVKNFFTSHKKELENSYEKVRSSKPATAREGPTLLLGASPASEVELRAELPHKSSVLALCSRYFNSMDNAVSIIHGPAFLQQLRNHWEDPAQTPIMWLGLLYSILTLAMLSYQRVGDEPPEWRGRTLELAAEYRLRTVQCLMKADYTKPVEHTVETMLLYVFGEYSSRWDADLGLWMIVSSIIRVAFRMGYHRDAKWFPSLTPYQAEMRRRTWALVRMADCIFSHQVSLPSMIYDHDCDTQLPNNIYDDEFNPDTRVLPPSRPSTEATPISYMIAKARLCIELSNILQATNRVDKGVPYDEIIRFDAKLKQIMQELPPHLKLGSLADSQDPVALIIARFNIDILYQKIMCLLHRKYMSRARQNPRYAHSRRSAIEASLQAMEHLQTLHRESQSNGRLRAVGWYVKSIATKEFVLPAMLIVLDLHYDNTANQRGSPNDSEGSFRWSPERRTRMIGSLEDAAVIWKSLADSSMEAYKGAKTVEIMLQKLKEPTDMSNGSANAQADSLSTLATSGLVDPAMPALGPESISSERLPDFSTGLSPFTNTNSSAFMGMEFSLPAPNLGDFTMDGGMSSMGPQSPFAMFTNLGGVPKSEPDLTANFDWGAFENFAQMANWGADQSFQVYGGGDTTDQETNMMNTQ